MFREGKYLYDTELPSRLGYEASGIVDAVGPGVTDIKIGDRVSTIPAFSMGKYGVYGVELGALMDVEDTQIGAWENGDRFPTLKRFLRLPIV